jgi:xanthine dehydrogenase small subunit
VMSLFAMYQNRVCRGQAITRAQASEDLSGNLCRCTGYRPILDAARQMAELPPAQVDEAALLGQLQALAADTSPQAPDTAYLAPRSLQALLELRARHPQAQLVAGCTDVGLWVTKQHRQFPQVLDLTRVAELRRIERYPHHLAIGAAVPLADAFAALEADRPQLHAFAARFAGLPVRNAGTLGGNVANGSPIGDSMPLLIARGANVGLMRWDRKKQQVAHRELRLEDLYTGYRTNVMKPDELLCWIKVPRAKAANTNSESQDLLRVYKISKRFDDDISAVCLAIHLTVQHGVVQQASIGAGGVAATPVRARQTEAALLGQPWTADTAMAAAATLRAEFQPISDMRASAHYRQTVLGNLLQRFWLESQGMTGINLDSLKEVAA